MAVRSDRLEARLTPAQRTQIEQAAGLAGESLSSFVVFAALERADTVVAERAISVVPAGYFDRLIASLDEPDDAPQLARAARGSRDRGSIRAA